MLNDLNIKPNCITPSVTATKKTFNIWPLKTRAKGDKATDKMTKRIATVRKGGKVSTAILEATQLVPAAAAITNAKIRCWGRIWNYANPRSFSTRS